MSASPSGRLARAEIEKAKQLLDTGVIDRDEFEAIKGRAPAG